MAYLFFSSISVGLIGEVARKFRALLLIMLGLAISFQARQS
jgi:hypothetical protein